MRFGILRELHVRVGLVVGSGFHKLGVTVGSELWLQEFRCDGH